MTAQAMTPPTAPARRDGILNGERLTRLLLAGGMVGPLLFIVVLLIEGATRPGYDAWRHFGSQLSLGEQGWEQIANFLVCGVLCVGFALGLRRALHRGRGATWGPILLGVFGLSLGLPAGRCNPQRPRNAAFDAPWPLRPRRLHHTGSRLFRAGAALRRRSAVARLGALFLPYRRGGAHLPHCQQCHRHARYEWHLARRTHRTRPAHRHHRRLDLDRAPRGASASQSPVVEWRVT